MFRKKENFVINFYSHYNHHVLLIYYHKPMLMSHITLKSNVKLKAGNKINQNGDLLNRKKIISTDDYNFIGTCEGTGEFHCVGSVLLQIALFQSVIIVKKSCDGK